MIICFSNVCTTDLEDKDQTVAFPSLGSSQSYALSFGDYKLHEVSLEPLK